MVVHWTILGGHSGCLSVLRLRRQIDMRKCQKLSDFGLEVMVRGLKDCRSLLEDE